MITYTNSITSVLPMKPFLKIEKYITEDDHKKAISALSVIMKHEIEIVIHNIKINEYFVSDIEYTGNHRLNITSSADALYSYWYECISGKSDLCNLSDGKYDFFASYPYGIDGDFLINALAMHSNRNLNLFAVKNNIKKNLHEVDTHGDNELINLSEKFPEAVAYLLLNEHTAPSFCGSDRISLKLKSSYNDKYWLRYQMANGGWLMHELPSVIKL